jgi:hypothetical protein
LAWRTGNQCNRAYALAALGHSDDAMAVARGLSEEWDRIYTMARIAPRLAEFGLVGEALEATHQRENGPFRFQTLIAVSQFLSKLPKAQVYRRWEEILRLLASLSREDLVFALQIFAPVIEALGGSEALEETCKAIEDVGRWWP